MSEQMPGELIYEYTVNITGVTSYGAPDMGALLSGAAAPPPQGAWYDVAFEGPIVGQKLRGSVKGIDGEITTEDGKKIALCADGVAIFKDGPPVGELRENATLTTSEPDYAWVNPLQVWAPGTVDLAKGEVHIKGYVV